MSSSCSYDCSAPDPPFVPFDNDITGVGVVTNYIATAGIAVLIILIYYFTVYQPIQDPFERVDQSGSPFRPNPVDEIFLRGLRRGPTYVLRRILRSRQISPRAGARLEKIFIKCILAMSDLQIVTGFSILISGFVQLRCGLLTYQWLCIVDLAWFSSLTHLSCLTLLRNHLHKHTSERLWRLFAMGALATFLIVGLLSTANYWWSSGNYDKSRPAICYLGVSSEKTSLAFWTNLVSVMLISIAFASRVVKLHRTLSVNILGRARLWLSARTRRILRIIFTWCCQDGCLHSLKRSLLYRPLLAAFLTARFLLDGWGSVFSEVCWLIVAFLWGICRLLVDLGSPVDSLTGFPTFSSVGKGDWSFGQVVSVVLLAAPLITILGYFDDSEHCNKVTSNDQPSQPGTRGPQRTHFAIPDLLNDLKDPEDPDNDWSRHISTLGISVSYAVSVCILLVTFFLYFSNSGIIRTPLAGINILYYYIPLAFSGLYGVILFSLIIEVALWKGNRWLQNFLRLFNMAGFLVSASYLPVRVLYLQGIFAGLYILCALVHRVLTRRE